MDPTFWNANMKPTEDILNEMGLGPPEEGAGEEIRVTISKRQGKHTEAIEAIRFARDEGKQSIAYNTRPFVLCGLPIKRPPKQTLVHIRRNGAFFLRVAGDPEYGLPFGQDRLIPLWVATLAVRQKSRVVRFDTAAEILDTFNLPKDGRYYRRLVEGFKRVFTATIFFGTEDQLRKGTVWDWARFHFFDRMQVWYSKQLDQPRLPSEDFENVIVLSEAFWKELEAHPIPVDLNVVRSLADAPGNLDFYMWVAWRCWKAKGTESLPLFGEAGLISQLGVGGYGAKWKFRQTLKRWIATTKALWPGCPAQLSEDGDHMVLHPARAVQAGEFPQGVPVEN